MRRSIVVLACMVALGFGRAWAIDTTTLSTPELQARYEVLTHELRCMQCQNQSIADSPVGLASDLRREVAEQLEAGRSDQEVRDYMSARYGDFILFRPKLSWRTAWLWSLPFVLLLGGVAIAVRIMRQRGRLTAQDPFEEESPERRA